MPPCVPLARRTRTPGQAGTRGGWGGTPSAARLLDFRIVVRDFFVVFPVDYGHPAGESARSASSRFTDVADGAWEEYLLASSGPYLFSGGELHEKDSSGKCVRRVDRCGRACGGSLQPREKRQPRAAQNYALRRFEMDADHEGLRSCDGGWGPRRRRNAIRGAHPVR